MPSYIHLIQFKDQGIRNIQDTVKRGDAAIAEAEKMGMKVVEEYWTMGAHDAVVIMEAPDDATMSAFALKVVRSVTSQAKPCARFAEVRWKRFWRKLNSAF
jgi:uncharacterized protein with GYD domain